jgi:uncharacterized cupredoxin-like copper-binding protein
MRALFACALALAVPASAQTAPRIVEVQLASFSFTPSNIHLRGGEPVVLRLINGGRGGHNFSAPEFFAASQPAGANVRSGAIEVPSNGTVEVRLVPQRGSYALRCTHTLHTACAARSSSIRSIGFPPALPPPQGGVYRPAHKGGAGVRNPRSKL